MLPHTHTHNTRQTHTHITSQHILIVRQTEINIRRIISSPSHTHTHFSLTVAGSCTVAVPGRTSPSPPASAFASEPRPTPSGDPAGCTRPDRCCWCLTENSKDGSSVNSDVPVVIHRQSTSLLLLNANHHLIEMMSNKNHWGCLTGGQILCRGFNTILIVSAGQSFDEVMR